MIAHANTVPVVCGRDSVAEDGPETGAGETERREHREKEGVEEEEEDKGRERDTKMMKGSPVCAPVPSWVPTVMVERSVKGREPVDVFILPAGSTRVRRNGSGAGPEEGTTLAHNRDG